MQLLPDQVSAAVFLAYRSLCNVVQTIVVLWCFQPIGAYGMTS